MQNILNGAGPITPLGAGLVEERVAAEVAQALRRPADIAALQAEASAVIRRAFGCEAGAVVGCTAAGIAVACAAAMTGSDLARVEQLPDTSGMKSRVALQRTHDCWFGAYVGQMIRLSGARIDYVEGPRALHEDTAAAVYVASHHVPEGGMGLEEFMRTCADAGVPVIVDAAGSVDLRIYLQAGASLALGSAHKNFGGATAGIVAGRKDLVAACLLQDRGIGRAMKVGKEGIVSVIAGLNEWLRRPSAEREAEWKRRAEAICARLGRAAGLTATLETDPPENRIYRARVAIDERRPGVTARDLAERLKAGDPPVRVWEAGIREGYFAVDPRCLTDDQAAEVCDRIISSLEAVR